MSKKRKQQRRASTPDRSKPMSKKSSVGPRKPSENGGELMLSPAPDQLSHIIRATTQLLDRLQESALVEELAPPPLLPEALQARRQSAVHALAEFDRAINAERLPLGNRAIAVCNWPDTEKLVQALGEVHHVRELILRHWGLETIVVSNCWMLRTGAPVGEGERPALDKPLDWPPPIPLSWWQQARYSRDQLVEGLKSGVDKTHPEQRREILTVKPEWISATKAAELSVELRKPKSLSWIVRLCKKKPAPFACRRAPSESAHGWDIERHSFVDYLLTLPAQEESGQPAGKRQGEGIFERYMRERQSKESERFSDD